MGISITSVPTSSKQLFAQNLFWDNRTLSFYFADILTPYLFRYSYKDNKVYAVIADGISSPGFFIPTKDSTDEYIVSMNGTIYAIKWNGQSEKAKLLQEVAYAGTNDIHLHGTYARSDGALYVGSYGNKHCVGESIQPVYRYTKRGGLKQFTDDFVVVVAIVFDEALDKLYIADACTKKIKAFDWNQKDDSLCKKDLFL